MKLVGFGDKNVASAADLGVGLLVLAFWLLTKEVRVSKWYPLLRLSFLNLFIVAVVKVRPCQSPNPPMRHFFIFFRRKMIMMLIIKDFV